MARNTVWAFSLLFLGIVIGWISQDRWPMQLGAQPPTTVPGTGIPGSEPFRLDVANEVLPPTQDDLSQLTPEEVVNIQVYDHRNSGVVYISTKSVRAESFLSVAAVEGSGSGSIIDRQGHVLTNHHVIDGARQISVTLFNGEAYPAELIGQDPDNDIAILKIDAPEDQLFPIPFGDSSRLRVGQRILAIGNPFGLERTMSDGIISSLNRQLPTRNRRTMKSIIQIDAALNQGNSGGPLLNTRGELIGMNTAIATSTGDNAGIGFSIPSNTIRRVVPQLIANGRVIRPTIGITRVFETEEGLGIVVVDVTPNGPADQAGIQGFKTVKRQIRRPGVLFEQDAIDRSNADIIIGANQMRINKADDLLTIIESKKVGDRIDLVVLRKGKQVVIPVTLGAAD